MALELTGKVGPQALADGAIASPRLGKTAEQVVQQLHSERYEVTKRGGVFIATNLVAGVAPGTALSATPPFALYNPVGSGVDLVLLSAMAYLVSGTLGAGFIALAGVPTGLLAKPTGGTVITPIPAYYHDGQVPRALAWNGATIATTPTLIRPVFSMGSGTPEVAPLGEQELKGSVIIPPGCIAALQGVAAAGTSPLMVLGLTWEEVPV